MSEMGAIGSYQGLLVSDPDSFVDIKLPIPEATGHDILVEIKAVSVNPVDTKMRIAYPKSQEPLILGYDAVGIVKAIGSDVDRFEVGDRVYYTGSNQRPGSNEQFQLVDERLVAYAPKTLSDSESAAMPLTALTAYELLFEKLRLKRDHNANQDQSILVINGAGGVGSILIQLAKWAGLKVATTCSPKNDDWVKQMGADVTIDYHQDLIQQMKDAGMSTVNYIVILYATDLYFEAASKLMAPFGHIASIVETDKLLPLGRLKNRSGSFDWEFMFAKSDFQIDMVSQGNGLQFMADLFDFGELHSTVTKTIETGINAQNIRAAHELVESGTMRGKVVVTGSFDQ